MASLSDQLNVRVRLRGDIQIGFQITHGLNDWINDGIIS